MTLSAKQSPPVGHPFVSEEATAPGPLAGITVLDFTRVMAGPFATQLLADLGAKIIKVEEPGGDPTRQWGPSYVDGISSYFASCNRSKLSIGINLKLEAGAEIARRLAAKADLVFESFRPGVADRLGVGYGRLSAINPSVIYVSISAFGQEGARSMQGGFNGTISAMSGVMGLTRCEHGHPARIGVPIVDCSAGLFAVSGALAALHERERSGKGSYIDASLMDAAISLLTHEATAYLWSGREPSLGEADLRAFLAPYGNYMTASKPINIGVGTDSLWRRFCEALDRPDLRDDARFERSELRAANRSDLDAAIQPILLSKSALEWEGIFRHYGVPAAAVRTLHEVFSDPNSQEREMVVTGTLTSGARVRMLGLPLKLRSDRRRYRPSLAAVPSYGSDRDEILELAGYTASEATELCEAGVVAAETASGASNEH